VDLDKHTVSYISDIPQPTVLTKPASIVVDDTLYVFDCYSQSQAIYMYDITRDSWKTEMIRTKGAWVIPRCLKGYVFRVDRNELIFFCGLTGDPSERSSYFYFDLTERKFNVKKQDNTL